MIPKARRTGNFMLLGNRAARELLVDTEARVRAVSVVNTVTRKKEGSGANSRVQTVSGKSVRILRPSS
jgi:hypothetical protein